MAFIITQLTVYNYNNSNKGLKGTVHFKDDRTESKMEVPLLEEDAIRIFEIFGDRLASTMQVAAMAMLSDISARVEPQIAAPKVDDDIPF